MIGVNRWCKELWMTFRLDFQVVDKLLRFWGRVFIPQDEHEIEAKKHWKGGGKYP